MDGKRITYTSMAQGVILKELDKNKSITKKKARILFSKYCNNNNVQCDISSAVAIALNTLIVAGSLKRIGHGLYIKK